MSAQDKLQYYLSQVDKEVSPLSWSNQSTCNIVLISPPTLSHSLLPPLTPTISDHRSSLAFDVNDNGSCNTQRIIHHLFHLLRLIHPFFLIVVPHPIAQSISSHRSNNRPWSIKIHSTLLSRKKKSSSLYSSPNRNPLVIQISSTQQVRATNSNPKGLRSSSRRFDLLLANLFQRLCWILIQCVRMGFTGLYVPTSFGDSRTWRWYPMVNVFVISCSNCQNRVR